MAGKHDLYVIRDGDEYYVRPGVVIVDGGPGSMVRVRNLTGHAIQLKFSNSVVEGGTVAVGANDKARIPLAPGADGLSEFFVDVKVDETHSQSAKGNSWPKIIVDP